MAHLKAQMQTLIDITINNDKALRKEINDLKNENTKLKNLVSSLQVQNDLSVLKKPFALWES